MKTLIVDRVKLFRDIIVEVLRDSGVEHVFANNGKEALAAMRGEHFDCICSSLVLDDMDGIELCRKLRDIDEFRYTPFVLLTTESSAELIRRASSSGVTDVFLKDKINELVNFIKRFSNVNKPISGQVLYIEDQKSQRDLVVSMFQRRGIEVDAFNSAEEAWLAFLQKRYHLVVTDIVLEGAVSGVNLINKIRRLDGIKGEIPILAVTAFDNTSRRISLFHMGVTDYVTKPIIQEELLARVNNLITNQKALEREKEFREHMSSEEVLRRSLKMEALGKLTGGIAHDFNNVLGVVTGYAKLLERELEQSPELLEGARQIFAAGRRGQALTRKLMGFTRKQPAQQQVVDVNDLMAGLQDVLEKSLTATVSLKMTLGEGELLSVMDPNDFHDAILNLCINAKHAMHDQGELLITTKRLNMKLADSEALGLTPGEYVLLSVCDTGAGMDAETKTRIFDPFFTTKGEGGTGLGLSQVYGFVERSGGSIDVATKPGDGSCFNLYFPWSDELVGAAEDNRQEVEVVSGEGKTVLVVDDEEALCQVTRAFLEHAGYSVLVALSVKEALEVLSEQHVDLLITDIIMPRTNGYVLLKEVQQNYPEIKLMISSGYDEVTDEQASGEFDAIVRLQKPVDMAELIGKVQELLH